MERGDLAPPDRKAVAKTPTGMTIFVACYQGEGVARPVDRYSNTDSSSSSLAH